MRTEQQIKEYWDDVHVRQHLGALSGCEYQTTIDFLQITNVLIEGCRVLEVGVGLGYVTKGLKEHGMIVSALDISTVALDRVREYCEGVYLVDEIDKMPTNYFDVVFCHNGVQHIPTYLLEMELFHLLRSLKKGGIFALEFISTDLTQDTGVDSEVLQSLGWDDNIGCYCRQPDYLEKMIKVLGGKCKLVYDKRGDIAENITGCHIFHVTKTL